MRAPATGYGRRTTDEVEPAAAEYRRRSSDCRSLLHCCTGKNGHGPYAGRTWSGSFARHAVLHRSSPPPAAWLSRSNPGWLRLPTRSCVMPEAPALDLASVGRLLRRHENRRPALPHDLGSAPTAGPSGDRPDPAAARFVIRDARRLEDSRARDPHHAGARRAADRCRRGLRRGARHGRRPVRRRASSAPAWAAGVRGRRP